MTTQLFLEYLIHNTRARDIQCSQALNDKLMSLVGVFVGVLPQQSDKDNAAPSHTSRVFDGVPPSGSADSDTSLESPSLPTGEEQKQD